MGIFSKKKIKQIASNDLRETSLKDFKKNDQECTKESYSFLVNGTNLLLDNPLKYRSNLL